MANEKLTALSALTTPVSTDLLYIVSDPGGTPTSKKVDVGVMFQTVVPITEVSVTGGATLTSTAYGKQHVMTGTSADYTVVLPTASGHAGEFITVRMSNALTKFVTMDGGGSEIDGQTTRIMWAGETAVLMSDGTNFVKIAGKSVAMTAVMRLSADSNTLTNNNSIIIPLDTSVLDNTGRMVNTGGNQVDIKRPGQYRVIGLARVLVPASSAAVVAIASVNGTSIGQAAFPNNTTNGLLCPTAITNTTMAVNDAVELYCYQISGSTATAKGDTLANGTCTLEVSELVQW